MCKCIKKQRASKNAQSIESFQFFYKKKQTKEIIFLSSTETIHLRHTQTHTRIRRQQRDRI
jgi:hypothetical protein